MADGFFTVNTDEIRAHADHVEEFGGRADVAADAGAHLTTLDDAYGLACQPFGQMLVEPQSKGTEGLAKAAGLLHRHAGDLGATAEEYEQCEHRIVELIEDLLESLNEVSGTIPGICGGN